MKYKILKNSSIALALLLTLVVGCQSSNPNIAAKPTLQESYTASASGNVHVKYGLPSTNGTALTRTGYVLLHDSSKKVPLWVSYYLTADNSNSTQLKRSNKFMADPDLLLGERAELNDYKGSGYDRGHMCPNADQSWNAITMKECFYLSNMLPQVHSLNAGKWGSLESQIRAFVKRQGAAWIICGPVFKPGNNQETIGANKVWVPAGFYKVVVYESKEGTKAVGFEIPHKNLTGELKQFIVRIRDIETETGLNFLSMLPEKEQDRIETVIPASPEILN